MARKTYTICWEKMLRIDVDRGNPYDISDTNPFAKGNGHPDDAYGFAIPGDFHSTGILGIDG